MFGKADKGKKVMPTITTYNSDDSGDNDDFSSSQELAQKDSSDTDDEEDDRPLAEMFPACASTQNLKQAEAASPIVATVDSVLPYLSDSSNSTPDNSDTDEFEEVANHYSNLPITELIASDEFTALRRRIDDRPRKPYKLLSAYALFLQETKSKLRKEKPDLTFSELSRYVAQQWSHLSRDEIHEYKRRGSTVKPSDVNSLFAYKTRLLNLTSNARKQCSNPLCTNPVIWDPRWNGQYCSTTCVHDHCRATFAKLYSAKRTDGVVNGTKLPEDSVVKSKETTQIPIKKEELTSPPSVNTTVPPSSVEDARVGIRSLPSSQVCSLILFQQAYFPIILTCIIYNGLRWSG
ncbi:unnamed protein product [Calicophoron daubneyi]|uniref:HMG box domain-containing protein n=1 Tax=Calicophoron daubneyi TaxID=300641 RepID=A0AAV2TCV1_CALDB